MDRILASLNLAVVLALVACDPSEAVEVRAKPANPQQGGKHVYPGKHWRKATPELHGLSSEGMDEMADVAEELGSTCMMVIQDGVVVGEYYADGFGPNTVHDNVFAVAKSVTGSLVGIARAQGLLTLDEPASNFVDEWVGSPSEDVTIRNLVSNDSGRFYSFETDFPTMMFMPDQTAYAVGLDQAVEPGTYWEYDNAAVQTLEEVLEHAIGGDIEAFAQANLFEPIGMKATMVRDPSGNPLVYQGLSTSCSDLARLGYLILRDGKWKNQQVVPQQWVAEATKPGTELNDAYGHLWWLNREGHVVRPSLPNRDEYDGKLIESASEDVIFAIGAFGQFVAIDPASETVVVRLQHVADPLMQFAADPDPVGWLEIEALMAALAAAEL